MKWRLLLDVSATACGMIAAGMAVICAITLFYAVTCIWSVPGTRYELHLGRGLVFVCQLHEFRDNVSFRWKAYRITLLPPPTPVPKSSPWWHGDNSWWQGIGYTVRERFRTCGFEYASGRYWPPFVWQHPEMPFTVYQVPMWAIIVPFTLVPLIRMVDRSRESSAAARAARKTVAESTGEAGM